MYDQALVFDAAPLENRATQALNKHYKCRDKNEQKKARVYESWLNLVRPGLSDGALRQTSLKLSQSKLGPSYCHR